MVRRCKAKNVSGSPCSSTPVRDDGYCYWHSPALAAEREAARRRGGAARSNQARAAKHLPPVLSSSDLLAVLSGAMRRVERGELEPGPANAMAALARAMNTIREATEFENRLATLEAA